jgi:glucose-1-phosphate thymidylyltransferase
MESRRMKAILLAGGSGTRLAPMTAVVNKQLLPLYDKPMIYYPLSTLMMAGVRELLVISTPNDLPAYQALLGDGSQWGIGLHYQVQQSPKGIAQACMLGEAFIDGAPVCLMLGDNVFFGHKLIDRMQHAFRQSDGVTVFAYHVSDPGRYGVVAFDREGRATSLEEKPEHPQSNWAVTGMYVLDAQAVDIARSLTPSARGELEITDLLRHYLMHGGLRVEKLGRGTAWLDTGTPQSMLEASQFIHTIEARQGLKIGCLEEVALRKGFIDSAQASALVDAMPATDYATYLRKVIAEWA